MMDWTDRHCRFFHRLLAPSAVLYTEMVTAAALTHGDAERLLQFNEDEHPVVLQVGGSDPALMARAARLGQRAGYDAININVGCPSERVQSGAFGACLMAEPDLVADCVRAMREAVSIPVTVKTRIGIDNHDSDAFLRRFVTVVAEAGCRRFDLHARIAILSGLSPKQNRSIPPLNYDRVFRLKRERPDLDIVMNGGITRVADAVAHLEHVDGVMIGREAYQNPYSLTAFERRLGSGREPPSRHDVVERMQPYIARELAAGTPLRHITRHMLGLYAGQPGARHWRRTLSERGPDAAAGFEVVREALAAMSAAA